VGFEIRHLVGIEWIWIFINDVPLNGAMSRKLRSLLDRGEDVNGRLPS